MANQYTIVATSGAANGSVSLITNTGVVNFGTINTKATGVMLTRDGTLYIINDTNKQIEVFYNAIAKTGNNNTPDAIYNENSNPALFRTSQTINSLESSRITELLFNVYTDNSTFITVPLKVYTASKEAVIVSPDFFIDVNNTIDLLKE